MLLTIEGYQSIQGPLTLKIEGLTVVTGESNIGKSAIVRAFAAALNNQVGNFFITNGRDSTRVTITENGHEAIWVKTQKTTEYRIDGRDYIKAGRGAAPTEIERLGFYTVKSQDSLYRPQIHRQFERPFIIGEKSPITAADLLSSNKYTTILMKAIKNAKATLLTENNELTFREKNETQLLQQRERAKPYQEKLTNSSKRLDELGQKISQAKEVLGKLQQLREQYKKALNVRDAAALLPVDPLPEVPKVDTIVQLKTLNTAYKKSKKYLERKIQKETPVRREVVNTTNKLRELRKHRKNLKIRAAINVNGIPEKKTPGDGGKNLKKLRDDRRRWLKVKDESEKTTGRVLFDLEETEKDLKKTLQILGKCPICGK